MLEELQAFSLPGVTSWRTVKLQGFSAHLRIGKIPGQQGRQQSLQLNARPPVAYTPVHLLMTA